MTTVLPDLNTVPVEVTYDTPLTLNVGMRVNQFVAGAWAQLGPVVPALPLAGGGPTYGALFTPAATGVPYIVELAVYTDNTFTTYHPDYSVSSRSFEASATLAVLLGQISALIAGGQNIVAVFDADNVVCQVNP
jgi:hypothetical protein